MRKQISLQSYTVTISRLRLYCHHGVMPQERKVGNWFEVTVVMDISPEMACGALDDDDPSATVSYADAAEEVARVMATPSRLLEHAATRIVEALICRFPIISGLTVVVEKIVPPIGMATSGASVTLTWKA